MSDTNDHSALPDDELLAAEYALGVLAGADRAAAQRRWSATATSPAWSPHGSSGWRPGPAKSRRLRRRRRSGSAIAAALPAAAAPSAGLWQSLAFWRGFALASALAAACLGAFIYLGALNRERAAGR